MIELKKLDPLTASLEEFQKYHAFINVIQKEDWPDDPPRSLEYVINTGKSRAAMKDVIWENWCLHDNELIVARVLVSVENYETNRHVITIYLNIHPDHRRRGHAKRLLRKVLEIAEQHQRNLVIALTTDTAPAGELFAQRLGASQGIETHTNQLRLGDLKAGLLETWTSAPKAITDEYELGCWENHYPENEIENIAALFEVMNTAPRENLQVEDQKITPEFLRDALKAWKTRGTTVVTLYLRHKPSGELVGYTETFWNPENPKVLWQGATGVLPAHRSKGLGKWLKAAMIQKVQQEKSGLTFIRTGNADSNAPMLAINEQLGFKPYVKETIWQLELDKLKAYTQPY